MNTLALLEVIERKQFAVADILKKPIVYHSLFWLIYFLFNTIRWGSYFEDYVYSIKSNLVEFSIHISLAYFNIYYLLPRLLTKGKVWQYVGALFLILLLMSFLRIILTYELVTPIVWRESARPEANLFAPNYIIAVMLGEFYVVGFTTAIQLMIDWFSYQKRIREIEKHTFETEMNFLKSQIQPHFFFNTLNNLYSLTLSKSDLAPEVVMKLSELMNYMLYETGNIRNISLLKEITHLQNYIDLERIRFGQRLELDFEISGNIESKKIPPMVLLPFIENAFKHGASNKVGDIHINIHLAVDEKYLNFEVENAKLPKLSLSNDLRKNGGIGLKNTRRRLDLIFEKDYDLKIEEKEDTYKINLKIPVDEN